MGCGSSSDAQPMVGVAPAAAATPAPAPKQPQPAPTPAPAPAATAAPAPANGATSATGSAASSTSTPGKVDAGSSVAGSTVVSTPRQRVGPPVPVSVLTDSYKASHYLMYPECQLMVAYGEFRGAFNKDPEDSRFVFYGIRYIIENYVAVQWTVQDVEQSALFYQTHNAGFTPFPFPKDLFMKFVTENRGYMPVRIEALPEGTVANVHVPVYQIFAAGEYSRLITFLETILTQIWYPSTVATLSRRTRDLIEQGFAETADEKDAWMVDYKLHDFGFRGCSSVEQSILGGCAHLLNFAGSDTMSAAYYAQMYLNNGKPVATSIPATEHSVMTSWPNERLAMENMIDKFGGANAVFSIVMDSYDYNNALTKVLPAVADRHKQKGGTMVIRPDSGDPVECILAALEAGEKNFPTHKNSKGYKVIEGLAAIQGDGINYNTVRGILAATKAAGFSAQNVAFGMGGGLLQKVNRDTMSFATKLSYIVYADGTDREVMKRPKTESGKISLPGILKVRREGGCLYVEPRTPSESVDYATNELKLVYDHGPVAGCWDDFTTIRERVKAQWAITPKLHDPIGPGMRARIAAWITKFDDQYAVMMKTIDQDLAEVQRKKGTDASDRGEGVATTVTTTTSTVASAAAPAAAAASASSATSATTTLAEQSTVAVVPPQQIPEVAAALVTSAPAAASSSVEPAAAAAVASPATVPAAESAATELASADAPAPAVAPAVEAAPAVAPTEVTPEVAAPAAQ